jgi:glycosyltransferase involved in cell wall biosynthesis
LPRVSVIVSCYNKSGTIRACLDSLLAQKYDSFEVVVVDDGSTDGSGELLDGYSDPRIRVVHSSHGGASSAKNVGIRQMRGEIALFLDGDCVVPPGFLEDLSRRYAGDGVDIVGGEVRALNSGRVVAKTVELMQNDVRRKWPFGANVAYTRSAIERIGFFDDLMDAGEDVDYYLRGVKSGFRSLLTANPCAFTVNPTSISGLFGQRFRWARGFSYLTEKHPEVFTLRIKLCYILNTLVLLSIFLVTLNPVLVAVPLVLLLADVLRFVPQAVVASRRTRSYGHAALIPILRVVSAYAYFLGFVYDKSRLRLGLRRRFERFTPP